MEMSHLAETRPPAALTSYTDELTRSNSDASSLAAEDSKDTFKLSAKASLCKCAAWAYEKHNQYLNRLEASFVKQLHQSMDLLAWCSEQDKNARNLSTEQLSNFAFEQTINLGKIAAVGSHDVLRSPWIKHFKRAGRPCSTGSVDLSECCRIHQEENLLREQRISSHGIGRHSEHLAVNYTYYSDSVGSVAEGSGQNFVDKDCEDDSRSQTKKLKAAVADDSSDDDQIVPSGNLHAKELHQLVLLH